MRDYGMFPWMVDQFTAAELRAVLEDQNERWKLIAKQNEAIERAQRKR